MLSCPVCKQNLIKNCKSYSCINGHCFDISKKGYVNLLMSQSSSLKTHGDDKEMTAGRRDFLNSGHYEKLKKEICKRTEKFTSLIDVGCGEGYYTCSVYENNNNCKVFGIDISKDIVAAAHIRNKKGDVAFAVAGCTNIPVADKSIECILSVFAPVCDSEFSRITVSDGYIIRVTPGLNHLFELKEAVYDNARLNEKINLEIKGFQILSSDILKYKFIANTEQIKNLFTMTPYYYKTSPSDKAKLDKIDNLDITAEFEITTYKKTDSII